MKKSFVRKKSSFLIIIIIFFSLIILAAWSGKPLFAEKQTSADNQTSTDSSPLHPNFPLLDESGNNVLDTGNSISTMNTCGACHNTEFISSHSYHADVGLSDYNESSNLSSGRPWDTSPGLFGKWSPIQYRYLSPLGDELVDLTTPEWLMTIGIRHVGGGPAEYSRNGNKLTELSINDMDPQTSIIDQSTGEIKSWDWEDSGVVEMNCFLCHIPNPDNKSRQESLHSGDFRWANTLTLSSTGIFTTTPVGFVWNPEAFDDNKDVKQEVINIQDPINQNCGLCHGLVHDDVENPLIMTGCSPERWGTITTGQIISPQRLSDSGMNLANKQELDRPWDIHAERLLNCTDCHYSLNNPLYYQESSETQPDHIIFDPRRVEIGEYLYQPLHQFARGNSAQSTVASNLKDTMRKCDSCHSTSESHEWLPYQDRHFSVLSCETCHIPQMYSSANQTHDWTVLTLENSARLECRGVEGSPNTIQGLITGFQPIWLLNTEQDGSTLLSPYNLITTFFWIYGDPPRPVRLTDLRKAFFDEDEYHSDVIMQFDSNNNGELEPEELIIDTPEKEELIKERLIQIGLDEPRITGEIQPYSINHDVVGGEWAIQDCQLCHSEDSRINQSIRLASFSPGNSTPSFIQDTNLLINGQIEKSTDGTLYYKPETNSVNIYILGKDNKDWVDIAGLIIFLGTLFGIIVHGGLRFLSSFRNPKHQVNTERVYMYSFYERLWHWLQTFAIMILIITGVIIHKPDLFGIFGYRSIVYIHNIVAVILAINAFLALFYHLASGEIKQFIPHPRGFFDQTISQALYYLRGIFKADRHPFEKTPNKKLNPLQQITYLAILNVLLPLQGLTGLLIWGAQRWPDFADLTGGLSFLAPFHTLIAWLFSSFVVLHVYLTTTGLRPLTSIQAMVQGWEEIEIHEIKT